MDASIFVLVVFIVLFCDNHVMSKCPKIISREEWNAAKAKETTSLVENPAPYVVVHHSVTPYCNTTEKCIKSVKSIQRYHMEDNKWDDIGYNFLIGGDGKIYEGRGWGLTGAHAIGYNSKSVGICLLGNFMEIAPGDAQLVALKDLIKCAEETNRIKKDYKIVGHRQLSATLCPGDNLFKIIKTWDHWEKDIE